MNSYEGQSIEECAWAAAAQLGRIASALDNVAEAIQRTQLDRLADAIQGICPTDADGVESAIRDVASSLDDLAKAVVDHGVATS